MNEVVTKEQIRQLIERAQKGETRAFNEVIKLYEDRVMSVILGITRDRTEAEDIFQEVFIKLFAKIRHFRFESDFYTYLYRMTVNMCFNAHRRKKRHHNLFAETSEDFWKVAAAPEEEPEPVDRDAEIAEAIQRHYQELPPQQQTVFALKYYENKKVSEISEILGVGEGTIKRYLFRARETLQKALIQEGMTP